MSETNDHLVPSAPLVRPAQKPPIDPRRFGWDYPGAGQLLHLLYTDVEFIKPILDGDKTFEVRKNDRGGFNVGDGLLLVPWDEAKFVEPRGYPRLHVAVTYVLPGGKYGVAEDYVVLGIRLVKAWV
jgi:hypothetical protein